MENEEITKNENTAEPNDKNPTELLEKSHPLRENGEEEREHKEETTGGVGEEVEENEASTTTNYIRRRSFKKPKPLFYIGGCNGAHLVEDNLTALGWERITDKTREDFKLKWCEIKSHNNYHSFREGEQMCYQIPNNKLLTTKIGLLTSLQEYDRVMNKVKKGKPRIMKYQDFFPETYRLDLKDEREFFFESYIENEVWISKPTGMNQGKGIYLIRSREDIVRLQEKIAEILEEVQSTRKLPFKVPMARIVQRYVERPLLLDGRKFDVRNYLLIACTNPLVAFYADGYCRLTCMPYDKNSTDLTGHLTNQFMQKKNPLYEEVKEDTVWSMNRFNDYVNENFVETKNLQEDWVHTVLRKRCQQIMLHCFQAVRHKLECRLGFFDLIGCDFLVDEEFKISLLEMNCNPALHTNCDTLREIIPEVVSETLKLTLEIFEKAIKRERIMPLAAQRNFLLLYNGDSIEAAERRERLQSAAEARRRARSAQRRKRFVPGQYVYKRTIGTTTATSTATTTTASSGQNPATSPSQANPLSPSNPAPDPAALPATTVPITSTSLITATSLAYRPVNLPSSTVTALTVASQQRVTKSKSISSVTLKPFYAGGTVTTTRPYSAPRVNRKYAQVESKVMTHNNLYAMESPRRDHINNAALKEASNSKIVNYVQKAKSVFLTPKREDLIDSKDFEMMEPVSNEQVLEENREDEDLLERENLFERILEEADEMASDDENELDLVGPGSSPSPEMVRRPSAKLPSNYHNSIPSTNTFAATFTSSSSWPRYPPPAQALQKKISKIASMSVRGNIDPPLPAVALAHHNSRSPYEQSIKMQYRAPTTVRIRQSLPATTCTLEIGPKSRRGLIAVSTGKLISPMASEIYSPNRKLNNTARLKLINTYSNHSSGPTEESPEVIPSSALIYLATSHLPAPSEQDPGSEYTAGSVPVTGSLIQGAVPMQYTTTQPSSQIQIRQVQVNNGKMKTDSSTQTSRRSNHLLSGEEKVIWRLRTRVADTSPRAQIDGYTSPVSQNSNKGQKVPLKVPVVTQSPSLISPRKGMDPLANRRILTVPKKIPSNSGNSGVVVAVNSNYAPKPHRPDGDPLNPPNPANEGETGSSINIDLGSACGGSADKPTALSKVVAIATAVPTHVRSNESKVKGSSGFSEEFGMLTAG